MSDTLLVFMLAGQRLALDAGAVRECLPLPRLWRRDGLPGHVAGFFSMGGTILPVLDLAHLLGLRDGARAAIEGERLEAGGLYRHLIRLDAATLLVDRVLELAGRPAEPARAAPEAWQNGCIVARLLLQGEPVALLDPERLLLADEQALLRSLAGQEAMRHDAWQARPSDAG